MDKTLDQAGPLLTINDVMERLTVGEWFVRRLIAERRIGYLKVGAKVRFTRDDVENFVVSSRRLHVSTSSWEDFDPPGIPEFLQSSSPKSPKG